VCGGGRQDEDKPNQDVSCHLTWRSFVLQVEKFIPLHTPALPYLRSLKLEDMRLSRFPPRLAAELQQLTHLSLACTRLPTAVTQITTLRTLNLSWNKDLQLERSDLNVLAALPHMRRLAVTIPRKDRLAARKYEGVVKAIGKRFPTLSCNNITEMPIPVLARFDS
jgi:hypothetical protein